MLQQSVFMTNVNLSTTPAMPETIKSRFGDVTVDASKSLLFPRGLLGMPDKHHFALAKFPNEKMSQFALLQSMDDRALSFITLPLELRNAIIDLADIQQACHDMRIEEANLALLLIVSVHRGPDQVKLSVNVRAPLFLDSVNKTGVQYVFQQDKYKVQHML